MRIEEIEIKGEPMNEWMCRFTVNHPVQFGGSELFATKEEARREPLASKIFELEGVSGVMLNKNIVTVATETSVNWENLGKKIGEVIRGELVSRVEQTPKAAIRTGENTPEELRLKERVQRVLDEEINPAIAMHGGHIGLLDVEGTVVTIEMSGGCQGCGSANATLRQGVEQILRNAAPEITEIIDVTDHEGGLNPYFTPSKA